MNMVELGLLRHGLAEHGRRLRGRLDDPLTPEGWKQMDAALQGRGHWDAVLTSPLTRCRDFAATRASAMKVPLRIDERLQEIHLGEWEGLSYEELMAQSPDAATRFFDDPLHFPPPGGEPVPDFVERVEEALDDALDSVPPGRRVLVVTHSGVIRVILCRARRWPMERLMESVVDLGAFYRLQGYRGHCEELESSP